MITRDQFTTPAATGRLARTSERRRTAVTLLVALTADALGSPDPRVAGERFEEELRHMLQAAAALSAGYRNTQWTPTITIAALTPMFSPRVPAFEMWWLRNSSISPGPRRLMRLTPT